MSDRHHFDVIVVGGGIAGASVAYFLAEHGVGDVLLLEREAHAAYHSTGRSAATLAELDTNPTLMRLKVLSAPFLRDPPAGFAENPLLRPIGVLALFPEPAWSAIREARPLLEAAGLPFTLLSADQAIARVPVLAAGEIAGAVLVPRDGRIDVHELLSSYRRAARRHGMSERFGVEVKQILVSGGRCTGVVTAAGERLHARWVVNAAGAWAGRIGALAGSLPVPLMPHRRTIVTFAPPDGVDPSDWPFVTSESHLLYFAPEPGGLLLSPMDEDPSEPCDAQPDELTIARGLARLETLAPRLVPRALQRRWSGLRTFVPDRVPVVGEDPRVKGFFWLAGQGGCGIETSPTLSRIAAELLVLGRCDRFAVETLAPSRFASS